MDPVKAEFKSNGLLEFFSVLVTWKAKGTVQTLQSVFYFSFTFHEFLVRLHVAAHTPPLPPPPGGMEAREYLRNPFHQSCSATSLFCKKICNGFNWLTPLADSFPNWQELVIYFHTNQQDGEQNAFMVTFSDNSDL